MTRIGSSGAQPPAPTFGTTSAFAAFATRRSGDRSRASSTERSLSAERRSSLNNNNSRGLVHGFPSSARSQTGPLFNPKFKLTLCEKFSTSGTCRYNEKCQFAHGKEELDFWTAYSTVRAAEAAALELGVSAIALGSGRGRTREGSIGEHSVGSTGGAFRRGSDSPSWRTSATTTEERRSSLPAAPTMVLSSAPPPPRRPRGSSVESYVTDPEALGREANVEFVSDHLVWPWTDPTIEPSKQYRLDDILPEALPPKTCESLFLRYDSASGELDDGDLERLDSTAKKAPRYTLAQQLNSAKGDLKFAPEEKHD